MSIIDHYRALAERLSITRRDQDGPISELEMQLAWMRTQMTPAELAIVDAPAPSKQRLAA